jgi:DNA (cytosine-5)-methyltransferase 1
MYIMAFSKKLYGNGVKCLTDMLPERGSKIIFRDLNDVLEPVVDDVYYMSSGYWETLKKHKARQKNNGNGFGYQIVNAEGVQNPCANTIMATGGSGKERNLIYQPKDGVAGKKLKTKQTELNGEGIRVMTPLEWGRLQGFIGFGFIDKNGVDTFSFPEGTARAQQYKQFGNSVTIPVIKEMAGFMTACFEKMDLLQKQKIIEHAKANESITIRDIIELLNVSRKRAQELLEQLFETKDLILKPKTKTKYQLNKKKYP